MEWYDKKQYFDISFYEQRDGHAFLPVPRKKSLQNRQFPQMNNFFKSAQTIHDAWRDCIGSFAACPLLKF